MKKTISLICILSILLFTLTGCYNSVDIDKYFYIIALGLDKGENDLLKVSIQIPSTSSSSSSDTGSSQSNEYNIYSVEAKTIDSAITILNNYLDKKINLSHCSALVISEELAKEGIKEYFTTLNNNTELRHSCELLISSTSAYDILDKVANAGEVFSSRLYDYLTTSTDYTAYIVPSDFGLFSSNLQNPQRDPIAIYSKVIDDTIQNDGTAVFDDDVMVGKLSTLNTIAHLFVTSELKRCILDINSPFRDNEKIDLEIQLYKDTDIDINIVNGSPLINITIYPEASIFSSGETYDFTQDAYIQKVEDATNQYLYNIVNEYAYKITKDFNTDIVGFGDFYAAKLATDEDFSAVHWDQIFKDSFFNIEIKTRITATNLFSKQ